MTKKSGTKKDPIDNDNVKSVCQGFMIMWLCNEIYNGFILLIGGCNADNIKSITEGY